MLPYVSIYFLLALLGISNQTKSTKLFLSFFLGFFLLLFMGTRYWVGCDYFGYLKRFDAFNYAQGNISTFLMLEEPGFHLLNYFTHAMGLDYVWLIFFSSLIIIYCTVRFSWLYVSPIIVLALFFPVMLIQLGMSGLRQALAVSFILIGLIHFCKGNRIVTGIYILLASTFHQSAVIFLPVAFLAGRDVSIKKLILVLLVASPFVAFLLGSRMDVYQDRYVDQIYGEVSSGGALLRFILLLIPCGLFFWKRKIVKLKYPYTFNLMNLYMLFTLALIPVALMSSIALHRLIFYIMPVSILVFLNVIPLVVSKKSARLSLLIPVFIYGVYIVGWFSTSSHADRCYVPYQSELIRNI